MNKQLFFRFLLLSGAVFAAQLSSPLPLCLPALAQDGMGAEQAEERSEMDKMRSEIGGIKGEINDALKQMNNLGNQAAAAANLHEVHLFAKNGSCEIAPGTTVDCFTYNGKLPGPEIHVHEGEQVKLVVHNQLPVTTSLIMHGLVVPQSVGGLPRKGGGMIEPGQAYVYQFISKQAGTYFYQPQINHCDQRSQGLYGAIIVEPRTSPAYERDVTLVLSDMLVGTGGGAKGPRSGKAIAQTGQSQAGAQLLFLMNGKSAPSIPPIEVRQGERVHLRFINAGQHAVPISLSGHRFEVVAVNGSDSLEPHVFRDQITVQPSDRYDVEFTADNPGVWSLSSEVAQQSTTDGRFPGGIACVFRYIDAPVP